MSVTAPAERAIRRTHPDRASIGTGRIDLTQPSIPVPSLSGFNTAMDDVGMSTRRSNAGPGARVGAPCG